MYYLNQVDIFKVVIIITIVTSIVQVKKTKIHMSSKWRSQDLKGVYQSLSFAKDVQSSLLNLKLYDHQTHSETWESSVSSADQPGSDGVQQEFLTIGGLY